MVVMSKATTLLLILTLLLCSTLLSYAARPNPPALPEEITTSSTPTKPQQHKDVEAGRQHGDVVGDQKCEEGIEEEECLMRRTLVAHLDYIYTQSGKNP